MKVSYGLPTHRVDVPAFLTAAGISSLTVAAESAGFGAVFSTEHPFPGDEWMAGGGHHSLDPIVTLAVAAGASESIRVHTNLFIPALRNPFLGAKAISSLDVVSGGRVILGVGAGYVRDEFDALGARFDVRNRVLDESIVAMRKAWSGESVVDSGETWEARGNTMLPQPVQRPHPPIWVGGNSERAMRRAVELGDGWSPFPAGRAGAAAIRTGELRSVSQLGERIISAREHAEAIGRTSELDVCFVPRGLRQQIEEHPLDPQEVIDSCGELAEVGVTWVTVALAGDSLEEQLEAIQRFGAEILPHISPM